MGILIGSKTKSTLTSDEYESFVRIGTPQERFKLQLPPPLEEVITPKIRHQLTIKKASFPSRLEARNESTVATMKTKTMRVSVALVLQ